MHGGEEIWECVCASVRSSGFSLFWLRDRCKLKKRKAPLAFLEGLSNLLGGLPEMRRQEKQWKERWDARAGGCVGGGRRDE